jgi:hypothetical protein
VRVYVSRPAAADPDGAVEILAMIKAQELPVGHARAGALADYARRAVAFIQEHHDLVMQTLA